MDADFIKTLGYKALDSRFKRISDRMAHDVRKLYKELNIDVEPNWYLMFMLLQEHKELSIAEIAEKLGYAHPTVVVMLKKMTAKEYIIAKTDKTDKRKQLISLTNKSIAILPELQNLWECCERAILQILNHDTSILTHIDGIDTALKTNSFHNRFKNEYYKK